MTLEFWASNFWRKVDIRGPNECWPWVGGHKKNGYGNYSVRIDGKTYTFISHRVAFALSNGYIIPTLDVLHKCDFRRCCNPSCLWQGTESDNMQDALIKGRFVTGEQHHWCKFSNKDVQVMKDSLEPKRILMQRYGISRMQLWRIQNSINRKW